jgi:hypothetical protein
MEPQIRSELNRVDAQRAALNAEAQRQGVDITELKALDGTYLLTPLILARSNLLLALAIYKDTKTSKSRGW